MVAVSSILFSLISIVITVLSIAARHSILRRQQIVIVQFDVIGQGVLSGKTKTKGIRNGLAPMLMVDPRVIDFERPLGVDYGQSEGLRIKMLLYVNHSHDQSIQFKARCSSALSTGGIARVFQKEWKLESVPMVQNLECDTIKSDEQKSNTVTVQMTSNSYVDSRMDPGTPVYALEQPQYNASNRNAQRMMMDDVPLANQPQVIPFPSNQTEGDVVTKTATEDYFEGVQSSRTESGSVINTTNGQ